MGFHLFQLLQLLDVLLEEHEAEAHAQQQAGQPDGPACHGEQGHAADACAQREQEDDGKVVHRLAEGLGVAAHQPRTERVHAAAQVADAHGAGEGVAVHLAEGLHLHRAGEGDDGIGQQVQLLRQKAHDEEQQDLEQHHQLTPVEPLHLLQLEADELGSEDAQRKGAQGDQIPQGFAPLARKGMDRHQHDVAGLGVGKDLAAEEISINVLQTARDGEKKGGDEGFGHLYIRKLLSEGVVKL